MGRNDDVIMLMTSLLLLYPAKNVGGPQPTRPNRLLPSWNICHAKSAIFWPKVMKMNQFGPGLFFQKLWQLKTRFCRVEKPLFKAAKWALDCYKLWLLRSNKTHNVVRIYTIFSKLLSIFQKHKFLATPVAQIAGKECKKQARSSTKMIYGLPI